ncbi:hypothetical protein MPH_13964 [Macrophomina phaseolina MS6]|uniref:Uncharacterized protein n=1 Tax=Macrophomina phaseolina (strain MS6) TaxID=1126212 RepID=K2RG65_MACPH|nr:hypothetical protein MPH_13964 [Macrophomina phaseolina MS6]
MLGCILLYALLAVGLLQLVKKPLALLLQPTTNFETVFISNSNIPKIIHQTYANTSIPDHWKPAQQSCLDLHPDYEYKELGVAVPHRHVQHRAPFPVGDAEGILVAGEPQFRREALHLEPEGLRSRRREHVSQLPRQLMARRRREGHILDG